MNLIKTINKERKVNQTRQCIRNKYLACDMATIKLYMFFTEKQF